LSAGRTPLEKPFPLPASSRPPRNCTVSAMISIDSRFWPSASHWLHSSRPSIATARPFLRYWAQLSACLPNTVTRKKLAFSSHWPVCPSLRRPLTARPSLQIPSPPGVVRCSGSLVRLPVSTTRLMFPAIPQAPFQATFESLRSSLGAEQAATIDLRGKWSETLRGGNGSVTHRDEAVTRGRGAQAPTTRRHRHRHRPRPRHPQRLRRSHWRRLQHPTAPKRHRPRSVADYQARAESREEP